MKTFRLILALAAVALTAVSCVEKSGKYQTLLAQRDSLLTVEQKYDQTLEILNEIETGFQSIREVKRLNIAGDRKTGRAGESAHSVFALLN